MTTPRGFSPLLHQKILLTHAINNTRVMQSSFMGSGKTVTTATWVDYAHRLGVYTGPVLVLAPKLVAEQTWRNEFAKWSHLYEYPVVPITGTPKQRLAALKSDAKIYTINYEGIEWLIDTLSQSNKKNYWPFGAVIADESTRLKNFKLGGHKNKRAKALAKVAFEAKYWHNLTGTITPNGLNDLWGQMYFIDKGLRLGQSFTSFRERWFRQIEIKGKNSTDIKFQIWRPLGRAESEITNAIKDVCCSIRSEDYFPVEKEIISDLVVELPNKIKDEYRKLEKTGVFRGEVYDAPNALKHQIAQGAFYSDSENSEFTEIHDVKIQALESLISELNGDSLLIVYHFKHDLARLRAAFKDGVEINDGNDTIARWDSGKIKKLFVHPASAGHGLNLQDGGNHICFFSNTFNYEHYDQVIARIGPARQRQSGHNRNVFVYRIICKGTIDDDMVYACEHKCSVQDAINKRLARI